MVVVGLGLGRREGIGAGLADGGVRKVEAAQRGEAVVGGLGWRREVRRGLRVRVVQVRVWVGHGARRRAAASSAATAAAASGEAQSDG